MTLRSGASAPRPTSKRTWSLPLPVQPCETIVPPCLRGRGHQVLDDQRPGQRGHQRVAVHVEGVGAQRRQAEVGGELLAGVDHLGLDGAAVQGPLADDVHVLAALADVDGDRDHLGAGLLGQVRDGDGGVQASGEREDDPLGHGVVLPSTCVFRGGPSAASLSPSAAPPIGLAGHDEDRVVAGDGADDLGQAGAVDRAGQELRRARRGAQHDQVAAGVGAGEQLAQQPDQPGRGRPRRRAAAGRRPRGSGRRRARRRRAP